MEQADRVFNGIWIPKEIYLNKQVKWGAKILFLEIHSFTANGKSCFMSNEYISKFLGISIRQVTRMITELKNIGWIEETAFDGRKRFLRSKMKVDFSGIAELTKSSNQHRNESPNSIDKNVHDTKSSKKENYNINKKENLGTPNSPKTHRGKTIE